MTRLVVTSDWHLDWSTHGVDRFAELERAVEETVDAAIDLRVDAYVFLGDLCNPDAGSKVFRCVELVMRTACCLMAKGIPSLWLAGNHDVIEDGRGETTLTPLRALRGLSPELVYVAEHPGVYDLTPTLRVLALPFTATSHAYDPAFKVRGAVADEVPFLVAGHLAVPGCIPGEETTEMPRGREVVLPLDSFRLLTGERHPLISLVMNGHYHRRQTTNGVVISGSLARLTFGEERHEPGYLVVTL